MPVYSDKSVTLIRLAIRRAKKYQLHLKIIQTKPYMKIINTFKILISSEFNTSYHPEKISIKKEKER